VLGDVTATDSPLREAGHETCQSFDLPISDAAFDLIDRTVDYVVEVLDEIEPEDLDDLPNEVSRHISDWMSGPGVISCYTSDQVSQWAALGAWRMATDDVFYGDANKLSTVGRIGQELSVIAERMGYNVACAAVEMLGEVDG
jgi:hypothetical protein